MALSKPTNHLELYLKDVFEKECVCEITSDEVDFIKSGIETLVQKIADRILDYDALRENLKNLCRHLEVSTVTPDPSSRIIPVGSVCEGTFNKFPREFDFVLPICNLHGELIYYVNDFYAEVSLSILEFYSVCQDFFHKLVFSTTSNGRRELRFGYILNKHRRFQSLLFFYDKDGKEREEIHVDLVPAIKCTDINLGQVLEKNCFFEPFLSEVLRKGYILFTFSLFSFSDIEMNFMRHCMSKNHKKVYRVLKVIINGHRDDGDLLAKNLPKNIYTEHIGNSYNHLMRSQTLVGETARILPIVLKQSYVDTTYSSYMIKTMVFRHHEECTNKDETELGPCIIKILNKLCQFRHVKELPFVTMTHYEFAHKFCLLPDLKRLLENLRLMQKKNGDYNYTNVMYKNSLSKKYADEHGYVLDPEDFYP